MLENEEDTERSTNMSVFMMENYPRMKSLRSWACLSRNLISVLKMIGSDQFFTFIFSSFLQLHVAHISTLAVDDFNHCDLKNTNVS